MFFPVMDSVEGIEKSIAGSIRGHKSSSSCDSVEEDKPLAVRVKGTGV